MISIKRIMYMLCWLAYVVSAIPARGDILAIRAGRILTVSGHEIEDGVIVVEDGKIKAVGGDVIVPDDAKVIDASDKTAMPGLIDAGSRLYLMDSELNQSGGSPDLTILDAVDPFSEDYKEVVSHGVTAVCIAPTSRSLLAGRAAVVRLNGARSVDKLLLKSDVAVKASIGLSSGGVSSSLGRLDHYASLRETFIAAQSHLKRLEKYEHALAEYEKKKKEAEKAAKEKADDKGQPPNRSGKPEETPKRPSKPSASPANEILVKILRREIALRIEAHRVDDILHALRLAEEFKFALVLDKCTEGSRIADRIAKHRIPVIAGAVFSPFADGSELEYRRHDRANAAILANNGIQLALGTSARDGTGSKFLLPSAAMAVAHGMDRDMALRAVTLTPAEILGVADRIGSLDVGKDADIVILSGDPLASFTEVETVLIQGRKVYERKAAK